MGIASLQSAGMDDLNKSKQLDRHQYQIFKDLVQEY